MTHRIPSLTAVDQLLMELQQPLRSAEVFIRAADLADPRLYRALVAAEKQLTDDQRRLWHADIDRALAACVLNCCM